jgi:hypothetical protein
MTESRQHPLSSKFEGRDQRWRALCLLLLFLAGVEFVIRGPLRALGSVGGFNDFLSPYIQAGAWVHGQDPYSPNVLLRLWPAGSSHFLFLPREVANGSLVANRGIPTAYPITALVLIAPFTLLPWKIAYGLWLAINLALFAGLIGAAVALAGSSYAEPRALLLVAAILALAPVHTGMATGNMTIAVVALAVIAVAVYAARKRSAAAAAVLLALSAGLKPQIGLCFLLYYFVLRRWRIVVPALAMLACLAAVGLLRLEIGHTPWLANYLNDSHVLLETGVLGNFTSVNPTRFGLINLQVALYPILRDVPATNDLAFVVGGLLCVVWLLVIWRRRDPRLELLDLSAIAVISLLPIYHRFYDAALLVLPLGWALVSFRRPRRFAVLSLLMMTPFLIPGGTLLETMEVSGRIPAWLANRWWWQTFVMAHEVWMLLLLSLLLLWQMLVYRRSTDLPEGLVGHSP